MSNSNAGFARNPIGMLYASTCFTGEVTSPCALKRAFLTRLRHAPCIRVAIVTNHSVGVLWTKTYILDEVNTMQPQKIYVEMYVRFNTDGSMRPVQLKWEDGQTFEIDKVIDVRRAASGAGGAGLRYTVKIMGQLRRLFFEDIYSDTGWPRWFVESGQP